MGRRRRHRHVVLRERHFVLQAPRAHRHRNLSDRGGRRRLSSLTSGRKRRSPWQSLHPESRRGYSMADVPPIVNANKVRGVRDSCRGSPLLESMVDAPITRVPDSCPTGDVRSPVTGVRKGMFVSCQEGVAMYNFLRYTGMTPSIIFHRFLARLQCCRACSSSVPRPAAICSSILLSSGLVYPRRCRCWYRICSAHQRWGSRAVAMRWT